MDDRSDAQLVAACRDEDRQAFATLVHRHTRHLFAVCLAILGDVKDCEDAVQESFLKGLDRIQELRDGERFAGWLTQIARNHCRDLLRQRKRRRFLLTRYANTEEREEDYSDLHEALDRLPEAHRLPLMLFYFDGRSTRSVAAALEISQGGACARLSRARVALREALEGAERE